MLWAGDEILGSIGTELEQWDLQCTEAEGFWARRARTSIDVLGPGILVGRVAGFGVSSGASDGRAAEE
jgi:hypothetical protein